MLLLVVMGFSLAVLPIRVVGAGISTPVLAMRVDPIRPRVYLINASGNSVVAFNSTSGAVLASVWVGSDPTGIDITPDGSQLYVAVSGSDYVAVVDLDTLTLTKTIHLQLSPYDIAAGRTGRAYVTVASGGAYPLVIDTNGSSVVREITAGGVVSTDARAWISPNRDYLYVSGYCEYYVASDNVSLIHKGTSECGSNQGNTFSISPDGTRLYTTSIDCYCVAVLNSSDWSSLGTLNTGPYPVGIGLDGPGGVAIASAPPYGGAILYNTTTFVSVGSFLVNNANEAPSLVALSSDGTRAFAVVGNYAFGPYSLMIVHTNLTDSRPVPVQSPDTKPPVWPKGSFLVANPVYSTTVHLHWSNASDDVGVLDYRIYEGTAELATVNSSTGSYNATGLVPGAKYTFTVQAGDFSNNWSTDGPSVNATTLSAVTSSTSLTSTSSSSSPNQSSGSPSLPIGEFAIAGGIIVAGLIIALAIRTLPRRT
jgi:YVTN family beta-propeller protein